MNFMSNVVGRIAQQNILNEVLTTIKSEWIAVYARRRIGKNFLIREFYKRSIVGRMSSIIRQNSIIFIILANYK
jgi:AAA+ ATPase superfamily predicted ATPase